MTFRTKTETVERRTLVVERVTPAEQRAIYAWGRRKGFRRVYRGSGGWWHNMLLYGRAVMFDREIDSFVDALKDYALPNIADLPAAKRRTRELRPEHRRALKRMLNQFSGVV